MMTLEQAIEFAASSAERVESFGPLRDGSRCTYLNTGDTYTPTLVRACGRYRIACWGDVAEREITA
jgi:hypothetical protein